jgi:proline-specific peptidase
MTYTSPKATEGEVSFDVPAAGKPCKTWYKIYGDLSSSSTGRPLVILHGGPGACHNYLLPLADLAASPHSIPIVLYDQIGNGNSTHLREKRLDTEFWVPDLFMKELDNLLRHLGIENDYDLLGQSWGGMLGSMWAMSDYEGAKGMKRLIISNSPSSMALWVEACNSLRKYLPRDVDDALERHERDGTYKNSEYEEAVMVFYKKHLCRVVPFPDYVMDSLNWLERDDTTYFTMWVSPLIAKLVQLAELLLTLVGTGMGRQSLRWSGR